MSDEQDIVAFSRGRLDQVLKALEDLASGNLDVRLPISAARDEMDAFALAVNILASELAFTTVSKEHVSNILSSISDVVLVVDRSGIVTDANRAAEVALGRDVASLIGTSLTLLAISPARAARLMQSLGEDRSVKDFQLDFVGAGGQPVPMTVNGSAFFAQGSSRGSMVLVGRDMTVLRELMAEAALVAVERRKSEELLRAKNAAEEASRLKTTFLANVSHEIRTPMTAILGFAELLQAEELATETRLRPSERLVRNGHLLRRLIDAILDLSQVESGKLEINPEPVLTADLAQTVASSLEPLALMRGLTLNVTRDASLPVTVRVDPLRARQVLLNIVGNAIKFTKKGRVDVRFTYAGDVDAGRLVVEVEDTGIGISEDKQPLLFQAFFQSDPSVRAQFGGSGLGLVVAREMTRAMGGDLNLVSSAPGVGSRFRVDLLDHREVAPVGTTENHLFEDGAMAAPPLPLLAGKSVLVGEDVADTRELLGLYLRGAGAVATIVENGLEVVETARRQTFDLILLDLRMPVMDGVEAVRRLRAAGFRGPVVAITAHAMQDEIDSCLANGFDDVLTKPISRSQLLVRLQRALT